MKIIFNADDFGISEENTQNISDCFDYGLDSCSVIVNNNYVTREIIRNKIFSKNKKTNLHLNLIEGTAITQSKENYEKNFITNKHNTFDNSFIKLIFIYYFSLGDKKKLVKKQIKEEIENQIKKYIYITNKYDFISIDSHQHVHLIPFIFDIILDLSKKYKIKYIRTTKEILLIDELLISFFSNLSNIIKLYALNYFSYLAKKKLHKFEIKTCKYFFGVMFTGKITSDKIKKYLKKLKNDKDTLEILLHPGFINKKENNDFFKNSKFKNYYSSIDRKIEKKNFTSGKIQLIKNTYV